MWIWNRPGTEKLVNGKQHSVWFLPTGMRALPQNILLNFRLELKVGSDLKLTMYLPSGISEIFCQMVSTPEFLREVLRFTYFWLKGLFHSVYRFFFRKFVFYCRFVAVRYLWVVCNRDKFCVETQRTADIRVAWLVYVRTYCLLIATLNQNNRFGRHPNNKIRQLISQKMED